MTNYASLKYLLLMTALLGLSACNQQKDDLQAFVAKVKAQQKSDIPPLPVMKRYQQFDYAAAALRDPFAPTVVELPERHQQALPDNGIRPDQTRLKEALEAYNLSDLQYVGTLEQKHKWALIRSPDGVIHRVQVGNYLGRNNGKILSISDTQLTLKEIVPDERGGNRYVERDNQLSAVEIK